MDSSTFFGKTIAVFSTAGIGDTLTDTVALRALRETFPSSRLIVVVHQKRREVLENNPHIDRLIPHSKAAFFRTACALGLEKPELCVVLRANDPDIYPLAYMASRRVLANPNRTRLPHLVTIRAEISPEVWDKTHGVEQTLMIVRSIGASAKDKRLVYQATPEEKIFSRGFLEGCGVPESKAVAVQVTQRIHGHARDWPIEHYQSFLKILRAARTDIPILILGGASEKSVVEILAASATATPCAGRLTLRQTAAVLGSCACLVTPDTGLMHLSYAVGCRTLSLLSIMPPERVGPYGYPDGHHISLRSPEPASLASLSPDKVYEALERHFLKMV